MPGATVRISPKARETLRGLARALGEPMQTVLDKALESYRRVVFFKQVHQAYAALRSDPEAWQSELDERRVWEATLGDGLDLNEEWPQEGTAKAS